MTLSIWSKRIAIGLAIGIVATVGVAWCAVARVSSVATGWPGVTPYVVAGEVDGAQMHVIEDHPGTGVVRRAASAASATEAAAAIEAGQVSVRARPHWLTADFKVGDFLVEQHAGWPLPALRSGQITHLRPYRAFMWPELSLNTRAGSTTLPIVPLLPGFVVNVLVYAGVYVGISSAISARRRSRVGRCVKCLYSMAGLPEGTVCPECGAARDGVVA